MPTVLFLCLRNPSNQKSWLAHSTLTCAQNAFWGLYPEFAPRLWEKHCIYKNISFSAFSEFSLARCSLITFPLSSNTKQSFSFSINEYQLRLGRQKAGMVHSVSGWTRGVQVKLWDPSRTRAIPKRLRGVFSVHDEALYKWTFTFTFTFTFRWNGVWWRSQVHLSHFGWCWISDLIMLPPDCWIIPSFPHARWNREVQFTEFVKQWILAQLHNEADA